MSEWKYYIKQTKQPMRPYIPGENLEAQGISVWENDEPAPGGMIAQSAQNPDDQWYVGEKFFHENYREATE